MNDVDAGDDMAVGECGITQTGVHGKDGGKGEL